jgi:hypothetical protein
MMRCSIVLLLTALSTCLSASPTLVRKQLVDVIPDSNHQIDASSSLLADSGYAAAWKSATGRTPSNVVAANQSVGIEAVGPIDGRNNYVSLFYKNGRYIVSLVLVSDTRGGLADGFTSTTEVASAIARNARNIMGSATGYWASDSWAFYSTVNTALPGFTVVAKNLLPRTVRDYDVAIKTARALSQAYGMSTSIPWAYPKNNKRADRLEGGEDFAILADFTPTVELANYLFKAFHAANSTASNNEVGEEHLDKRAGTCTDYNEKGRIKGNWAPWNTAYNVGCVGSSSNFP